MSLKAKWQQFIDETLPTRKNEYWKYANLAHLKQLDVEQKADQVDVADIVKEKRLANCMMLVVINGQLSERHSDAIAKNKCVALNDINKIKYPFASLNVDTNVNGFEVDLQEGINKPIYILHITTNAFSQTRVNFYLKENISAHIIEEYISLGSENYFNNIVSLVTLEKHAKLTHEKIQAEAKSATHIATTFVEQQDHSQSEFNYLTFGSSFARDDLVVKLLGQSAHCETSGAYKLESENQYVDYHIDIHHIAKNTTSGMLFKGVLGEKTKAVFNGRLYVEKNAQKISAEQGNHHLLLANNAESYSKPELEIYADDVKCKHGATTGQLDEEGLFYLQARGIDKNTAISMLLVGFMNEVVDRINNEEIRQRAQRLLA